MCTVVDIYRTIRHLIYEESKDSGGAAGTISAIWHMRSNIEYIQNLIHSVIDYAESVKNLLNWTIPHKVCINMLKSYKTRISKSRYMHCTWFGLILFTCLL